MFKNEYTLTVDLKKKMTAITPRFVQYDNATLIFKIFDGGKPYNLTSFTKAEVAHKRPDGQVIIGTGTIETVQNEEKVIRYSYLGSEMHNEGFVETSISIFSNDKKVSIQPFKVEIISDNRDGLIESSKEEVGLLQSMIAEVSDIIETANYAIDNVNQTIDLANHAIFNAESAAQLATTKATIAESSAINANAKAALADTATTNADSKATLASEKAQLANDATISANNATSLAEEATNNANNATTKANNATRDAEDALANVNTAINASNIATNSANQATQDAQTATQNANQATTDTLLAKQNTEQATINANNAIFNANTATTNATNAITEVTSVKNATIIATTNAETATQNALTATSNARAIIDNTGSAGDFVLSEAYKKNNLVLENGSTWIAVSNTQNNPLPTLPTTENTWWRLVAQRGVDGTGSVSSVNFKFPSADGNVALTPSDIGASPTSHTHSELHAHSNKTVLDKLTDDTGQLKYNGATVGSVTSVNGQTGAITGLETVTSSDSKIATKVDRVDGKQLSTEDFTTTEKTKLAGIQNGAQVNAITSVNGSTGVITGLATNTSVDDKIGVLTGLETTNKSNLVSAINELKQSDEAHLVEDATILKKGHVQLSNAVNSTDETKAATPKAVKTAYDLANGKQDPLAVEQKRKIYIQSTAPTSPVNGDIWIEV